MSQIKAQIIWKN